MLLDTTRFTSVTSSEWVFGEADERDVLALSQKFKLPEIAARVLSLRGIDSETASDFLNPTLKNLLPDPFHFIDMEKAAERVAKAVVGNEKIAIFGDYDVDGATSSALLKRYLRECGNSPLIYIPDRIDEGYGPNVEAMQYLASQGITLCITVDCGTLSFEPIAAANQAGMEVIVIDHHLSADKLPEAYAIVNPNRLDETSPYRYLAAVGMSFMLAVAVNSKLRMNLELGTENLGIPSSKFQVPNSSLPDLLSLLDLVALGTVCDVMPLIGLNRAFVAQGLKILRQRKNIGLAALSDVARIDNVPNAYHLGFILGPRINAGGRVGKSDLGARLLSTENYDEAHKISLELDRLNAERKTIEQLVLDSALLQAAANPDSPVVIAYGEGWHPGVIGIVASRLKERYNRPAAVIALEKGIGKASARSSSGFDLGAAVIAAQQEGLLVKGGGHSMAAGFTVEEAKISQLQEYLSTKYLAGGFSSGKQVKISGFISVAGLNLALAKALERLEPFGSGNPEPIFAVTDATLYKADILGENHLRCIIGDSRSGGKGGTVKAMAFRSADTPMGKFLLSSIGKNLGFAGKIRVNAWQGYESAQFLLEDVAIIYSHLS